MNKSVLWGAAVVVVAGLGYYQFSVVPAQKAAEAEAVQAAEAAAQARQEAKAAQEAAAEAEAAAAAKAAEDIAAAKAAAEAAVAATKAAVEKAAADAAALAGQAKTGLGDAASQAVTAVDPGQLLNASTFDEAKVAALIDASALGDTVKASLKSAVKAASFNPQLLQGALDQVKAALGL